MQKKDAAHIVHKHSGQLYRRSGAMQKDFSEDAIHNFRVAYKKLRAILRMLVLAATRTSELKMPRRIKETYSTAGNIRDRQLCIKRIKETKEKGCSCRKKIHAMQKEIKEIAEKHVFPGRKEFSKIEDNVTTQLPFFFRNLLIVDFIEQKRGVISEIRTRGSYEDSELHTARKSVKDILYATAIFKEELKKKIPSTVWNELDAKNGEELATRLGLFNDTCIALSFLEPAEIRKAQIAEQPCLRSIRRQWMRQKRRLKADVIKRLSPANGAWTIN